MIAGKVKFIRSQKKNAQLVYDRYIYNKKLTQINGHTTWRCIDLLKEHCKAVVVTKNSQLVAIRREHNHSNHAQRIGQRELYDEEEDLGDYNNCKTDSTNLTEFVTMPKFDVVLSKECME